MEDWVLTIALTIADRSAHIDAPTKSNAKHRGSAFNDRNEVTEEEYIPYDALSMLAPLTIVPSVHIKAAPTRKLE